MGAAASKPSGGPPASGSEASPKDMQQHQVSGSAATCPLGFDKKTSNAAGSNEAASSERPSGTTSSASACPVSGLLPKGSGADGPATAAEAAAAATPSSNASVTPPSSSSSCPVKQENRAKVAKYLHPHKYNVYSQRIETDGTGLDPTNNMPANPNQQPAPGQAKPLSTSRVSSTIPKGGDDNTWTYPSPQMFWNALTRKGKANDTHEDDMEVVVSIHNNMNELTWKKILEWEKVGSRQGASVEREGEGEGPDGSEPRLLRFLGRPNDTTPKALAKMMVGHPLPFDRHDWVVDRGGDERRYVIDYYYDDGAVDKEGMPELHSEGVVNSIKVDVRPALDGFRDVADRLVQMPLARLMGKTQFVPLSFWPSPTMKAREPWAKIPITQGLPPPPTTSLPEGGGGPGAESSSTAVAPSKSSVSDRDARALARVKRKCAKPLEALREAESGDDIARAQAAALKLEYCTARYLCKKEARAYKEALSYAGASGSILGGDQAHSYWADIALDRRLNEMRGALAAFTERQLEARRREQDEGGPDA